MTTLAWYPFYWGDYSKKTMHLSQGEHGAYLLLLRWIYTTEKPIPHKARYSIAQARLDHERADTDSVLTQFFERDGASWLNKKAYEIISEAKSKHAKFVEAGRLGGKQRSSNAQATLQASLEPRSSNHNHTQIELNKPSTLSLASANGKEAFSKGNGGKWAGNGGATIKDPAERLARFQKALAESFPQKGWDIVSAAADPLAGDHARCLTLCRAQAKLIGKGWPKQWPA